MRNLLNDVSDLSRTSLQDLKKILSIMKLEALIKGIENVSEDRTTEIEIPLFGKILVSSDFDFEFLPDSTFKKDVHSMKQDPENYLTVELKKLLKIGEK